MKLEIKNLLGNSFDTMYDVEPSMMICTPALDPTEPIQGYTDLTLNAKLNAVSELNLCVHKITENGQSNPCYGLVEKRKYIYMEGVGYFRITDCSEENSGDDDIKKIITAESKEAELGNINVPDLGTTDLQTKATFYTLKLYDAVGDTETEPTNLEDCVIKRIQQSLIGWRFDLSLLDKPRAISQSAYTFGTNESGQESIGENIYNFLTTTVAEAFEVIFIFDTLKSTIIPIHRDQYYNMTSLFFDRSNIVESSRRNEKEGTFCTCLELSPNEDLIPYINSVNPTGKYLYNFSYYLDNNGWMTEDLKSAITTWQNRIAAAGDDASDPQVFRCLEAWTAAKSMNEKAKDNATLYLNQYNALTQAPPDNPQQNAGEALKNIPLNSDVARRAAIKKDDGSPVSNLTIDQGLKNINTLESLCNALTIKENYRTYFRDQTITHLFTSNTSFNYNIIPSQQTNKIALGDYLTFRFRCTSLPQIGTNDGYSAIRVSLAVGGMTIADKDVVSVGKIVNNTFIQDSSSIYITKNGDNERIAVINKINENNEYYEIKWNLSGNIMVSSDYKLEVVIYGGNQTPSIKIQFDPTESISDNSNNFTLENASFEANDGDYYTYTNSDFIMDSTMKRTAHTSAGSVEINGYHIWTPAFPVFNNIIDSVSNGTYNKNDNIITPTSKNDPTIQYIDHDPKADLNPWFIANFYEVNDGSNDTVNITDIQSYSWSYTPFTEDMVEGGSSNTNSQPLDVIGYKIRLHFYGYVKINNLWTYKKLKVKNSEDNYVDYIEHEPSSLPNIPFTFSSIINYNLPKIGRFIYSDNTYYTEVQYMRIEIFTGNANIFSTLTVVDPLLKHNATQTDLFSFNNGSLYPENYFNRLDPPLYEKLFPYINTLEYTNENIIVVDTNDMAQRRQLASDFIAEAKKQFKQNIVPVMECTIDSGAEIFSTEYSSIRNELALGSFCQVEFDTDDYSELPLEEISINWQECNFSMTFGVFRKKGSRWADLIAQTISNQKAMDTKTTQLYSYILDDTLGSVSTALATNQINASALSILGGQPEVAGYTITDGGATFTSKDEVGNLYQVLIADGSVACSKINRNGTRETTTALGKYVVGNTVQWGLYGGAIIARTITADKIGVGEIKADNIDAGAVTIGKIGNNAVNTANIVDNAINSNKISESGGWAITTAHMIHKTNNQTDGLICPGFAEGTQQRGETVTDKRVGVNSSAVSSDPIHWEMLLGTDQNFGVDNTGKLYAYGADIKGTITVSGSNSSLGGWTVTSSLMEHKSGNITDGYINPGGGTVSDVVQGGVNNGSTSWNLLLGTGQKFGITSAGVLWANGANINGTITSDNGSIGGWMIAPDGIKFSSAIALKSDGIIEYGSSNVDRTLIGNFVCGNQQTPYIQMPNGIPSHNDSNKWAFLTGTYNTFRFGITSSGNVIMNGLFFSQARKDRDYQVISPTPDARCQIYIGNIIGKSEGITFPITTVEKWLMLAGYNNKLRFGIAYDGTLTTNLSTRCTLGGMNLEDWIDGKQDMLTPGTNITIKGSVISATDTTYSLAEASSSGVGGTNGLMSAYDKEALDALVNGLNTTTLTPRGSAGFNKLAPYRVIKFGPFGIIHIYMRRTGTNNPYNSGTYAYFASDLPVGFRPSTEQIFTIYDVEGQQFNIKIPAKSASNPGYLWIARIGGKMGENVPHTIQCDIWYEID